ncbi:hypothetical protein FsymDg_1742 [Candidatus Protofrankia datiscae]|uniref:Uncharacterized protein n=1 Tax=Candidatus Protofrankia datiscae TaxID=2716812 RepID=F8B5L9_9ACTN|nr:hypothetical protein FsymDg_1742 [Candidatus Protofrankia datiscae]
MTAPRDSMPCGAGRAGRRPGRAVTHDDGCAGVTASESHAGVTASEDAGKAGGRTGVRR